VDLLLESRDGSFISSLIAEHVNPDKQSLPWPYGKQVHIYHFSFLNLRIAAMMKLLLPLVLDFWRPIL
jgi:hypothetical protein